MKCNFTQDISSHLNAINIAIDQYFPGIEDRHNFCGLACCSLLKKALSVMMIRQQKQSFFDCAKIQVLKLASLGWI